jgi:hypothetical protein
MHGSKGDTAHAATLTTGEYAFARDNEAKIVATDTPFGGRHAPEEETSIQEIS